MENDIFLINVEIDGIKIKTLLENHYGFSSKLLTKLEAENCIHLNDRVTNINRTVYMGDMLDIHFPDETDDYAKIKMPIEIIYEDNDLLVLNKKPFRVVHPTIRHQDDTTANAVSYYFESKNITRKVRFVNRLDMNTTGVLVIAKNAYVHNIISQDMRKARVAKKYIVILEGNLKEKEGTINKKIAKLGDNIKREIHDSGKDCITHYKVIKEKNNLSMVEVEIETGRTHQIRVHFESLGVPVLGDELYGKKSDLINRQALHCKSMQLNHPRTKESIEFTAELPKDMADIFNND